MQIIEVNQENVGTRLSCFGDENKMAEQSAKHFTCFMMKYCLKSWQEQHMKTTRWTISAIWTIFEDLNRPLSPKFPNKDALSM